MDNPYLYKRKADLIIYHIQTNEQIHLSDKSRHDIHSNMYQAVMAENERAIKQIETLEKMYKELKQKGFPINWNEMKIRIAWEKEPIPPEVILKWMIMRENDVTIRCLIPDDRKTIREILGE